jgi:hypothetical protein
MARKAAIAQTKELRDKFRALEKMVANGGSAASVTEVGQLSRVHADAKWDAAAHPGSRPLPFPREIIVLAP